MYKLPFILTTLSPVILVSQANEQVLTETREYIHGNSLRGALAGQYIRRKRLGKKAHEEAVFYRWFLSGQVQFVAAYPCLPGTQQASIPLPRCLFQDKDGKNILDLTAGEGEAGYKGMRGFAVPSAEGKAVTLRKVEVKRRIRFHLARHSERARLAGTALEEGVFSYEALEEGQCFAGSIHGSQEDLQAIRSFFGEKLTLQIGRSKSVQYGQVALEFAPIVPLSQTTLTTTGQRIKLVCHTPLLLQNEFGMTEASPELLAQYVSREVGSEVEVEAVFAATELIEEFVGVWGMRRPSARAFSAGTVFCLKGDWTEEGLARLQIRLQQGLGCRCAEGFGQLTILEPAAVYRWGVVEGLEIKEPTGEIPPMVREMLQDMVKNQLLYQVKMQALQLAQEYVLAGGESGAGTSLAAKLEATLEQTGEPQAFQAAVAKGYHEHAVKRLRRLKVQGIGSLYWLLTTDSEKGYLQAVEAGKAEWAELCVRLDWKVLEDAAVRQELFREYWRSFFRHMRKGLQVAEQGGGAHE